MEPRRHDDLIFDVGMHRGEDSAAYLAQGYRVVAFEANPALVAAGEVRFAAEIAAGRLTIVGGAVAPEGAPTLTFYANPGTTEWSTIDPAWVARNAGMGAAAVEAIEVSRIDMAEALRRHGVPHYMKIDIEGADLVALAALGAAAARPRFISIESNKTDAAALRGEFALLTRLGYRGFKLAPQSRDDRAPVTLRHRDGHAIAHRLEHGASGPWGDDLPGPWLDERGALAAYARIFRRYRWFGDNTLAQRLLGRRALSYLSWRTGFHVANWYDTHARLG